MSALSETVPVSCIHLVFSMLFLHYKYDVLCGVFYVANMSCFVCCQIIVFSMLPMCGVFYGASALRYVCVIPDSCVSAEQEIQGHKCSN